VTTTISASSAIAAVKNCRLINLVIELISLNDRTHMTHVIGRSPD
jgi:hypothetical protein